jgi:hypothetical protein
VSWPSEDTDMSGGWRLEIGDAAGSESLFLTVLLLDGTATVVADDASGMRGVKVGAHTVRFHEAARGGTLDGNALPLAIEALPLLTP